MSVDPPTAELLNGFKRIRLIGGGADSEVWEIGGRGDDLIRAVKLVRPDSKTINQEEWGFELTRSLSHPHLLVPLLHDHPNGWLALYMGLGRSSLLDEFRWQRSLERPGLDAQWLTKQLKPVANAIDHLLSPSDRQGLKLRVSLSHGDIKPKNIIQHEDGYFMLADMGTVTEIGSPESILEPTSTRSYAAPECYTTGSSTASDQYSLAAMIYFLVTGSPVFEGDAAERRLAHLRQDPPLDRIDHRAKGALARALSKNPDDRWPSCWALMIELEKAWCEE
jgi:serine/threonine protein kinase